MSSDAMQMTDRWTGSWHLYLYICCLFVLLQLTESKRFRNLFFIKGGSLKYCNIFRPGKQQRESVRCEESVFS